MKQRISYKKIFQEPLVHFLIIGGLIFLINTLWGNSNYIPDDNEIHISAAKVEALASQYSMQMGRPAEEQEIKSFINGIIRNEVLSREAKLLGLDDDDVVITRRLVQKMEFMTSELMYIETPSDSVLQLYYQNNLSRYSTQPTISFHQLYIKSHDLNEHELKQKANRIIQAIEEEQLPPEKARLLGDNTMLSGYFVDLTAAQVRQYLGEIEFARSIDSIPMNAWHGPYLSQFGHHLVYIDRRKESTNLNFEQIKRRIENDYLDEERDKASVAIFEEMKGRYILKVDEELKPYYND